MNARNLRRLGFYVLLSLLGLILIYPLLWLFFGSFKSNEEILGTIGIWPAKFIWSSYRLGWEGSGQFTFTDFFRNSFELVLPTVAFATFSSFVVAYGFARFRFPFGKILFVLMLSTLMLPQTVVVIPRYILFKHLGWLDSYLPFIVPAILGGSPFYIFMQHQFLRGVPKELDESAVIDGCGSFRIMVSILIPLSKPILVSSAILNFIWNWNDFFNVLIYVSSVSKYTVSLALHMMMTVDSATSWNQVMAMSVLSMLPCLLIFFFAQRYFVEGISRTGLKG